jgi:putative endonuclease
MYFRTRVQIPAPPPTFAHACQQARELRLASLRRLSAVAPQARRRTFPFRLGPCGASLMAILQTRPSPGRVEWCPERAHSHASRRALSARDNPNHPGPSVVVVRGGAIWVGHVYILRCSDESYYVGLTRDLKARISVHNSASGPAFTASRRPVLLVYSESVPTAAAARVRERQIKRWSRIKKAALIAGDRQHRADRLDSVGVPVLIDERHHHSASPDLRSLAHAVAAPARRAAAAPDPRRFGAPRRTPPPPAAATAASTARELCCNPPIPTPAWAGFRR